MRIRSSIEALTAWRSYTLSASSVDASMRKLSSGLRVNSAADDAAGLGVSERLRSYFLGLAQATRNAEDGINLTNTADGALGAITDLLQRGRELAVQASNGIWDNGEKGSLQTELSQLLTEIDRIADSTTYNGKQLLTTGGSSGVSSTLVGLRSGWLQEAEAAITAVYGITGDNVDLTISLGQGLAQAGSISGATDLNGLLKDIVMQFDAASLSTASNADRIVARTLTQSVLARNSNYLNLSPWFISGASDYVAGADDLLQAEVAKHGVAAVVNALDSPWADDSLHQASAYLAFKFMSSQATLNGATMADVMSWLKSTEDLNTALSFTVGEDENSFINDFVNNGTAFLNNLIATGALTNNSVGGSAPGGMPPVSRTYSLNPTADFLIKWVNTAAADQTFSLHVGPGQKDSVAFSVRRIDLDALGLLGLDLQKDASGAIGQFDKALTIVADARSQFGSVANQLEHTVSANANAEISARASYSRIVDVDMAQEVTRMARAQLLTATAASVMGNSNAMRQNIAWLLTSFNKPASA